MKKWIYILVILLLFISFSFISLDPDFGWHLRMGQLISSSGIPATDPFSYTMASFPFVDHEWLTNVLIKFLYAFVGKWGLALVFGVLATISILLGLKAKINPIFRYSLIILAVAAVLPFAGVRPQVESWFFLALLLRKRWRYFLPVFFMLWANLHGGFVVGLVVLTVMTGVKSLRLRKLEIPDLFIVIASWLATLINPYGIRLWGEVAMQLTDTNLRWTIQEWTPSLLVVNYGFLFLATLTSILIFKFRKKFLWEELVIYYSFLIAAISSVRHIPLWVVISLPLVVKGFTALEQEITPVPLGLVRLQKTLMITFFISLIIGLVQVFPILKSPLNESSFYPAKAVSYLKTNLPEGNVFSDYNWGGYLIWKLPEKKVFVDGRMPSWRRKTFPSGESAYAFDDYAQILRGKLDYKPIFSKYQIDTVLLGKEKPRKALITIPIKKEPPFSLFKKLKEDGWKEIYTDDLFVILQKSNK